MPTRTGTRQVPHRPAGRGNLPLVMAVMAVAIVMALCSLVLVNSNAATTGEAAPVPAVVATALTEAATACPALTPARLAGQVMAATGFVATPEGGIAGLTTTQWETWKPSADALPDNAPASLTALAHLTCDMVGQVRAAGFSGDLWRLAVAALRTSVAELGAARGVPPAAADFVVKAESYTAFYTEHLVAPNRTPTAAAGGSRAPSATQSAGPVSTSALPSSPTTAAPTTSRASGSVPITTGGGAPAGSLVTPAAFAVNLPSFGSASGLRLNGSAQVAGGRLNLTTGLQQAGSAWAGATIDTSRSFTSAFTALISAPTDGLAFVVQAEGPTALGASGSGLGYGAAPDGNPADQIRPSLAVELDTWDNSVDGWDPAGHQHIAVTIDGEITRHLVWQDPGFDMAANQPVYVWVAYDAAAHRLLVYAAPSPTPPSNPLLSFAIDLRAQLGVNRANIGFTGATGLTILPDSHESVLAWFASSA